MPWGALGLCLLTYLPVLLLPQFYLQLLYRATFPFKHTSFGLFSTKSFSDKIDTVEKKIIAALVVQTVQTVKFMSSNLAYRSTVCKTGAAAVCKLMCNIFHPLFW